MLDLKKKKYISSKPGPGGTTLTANLADISLYDLYELVSSPEESMLKFNKLPITFNQIDMAILNTTESYFDVIKEEIFHM